MIFHPVVTWDLVKEKIVRFDFSIDNKELAQIGSADNFGFNNYVSRLLEKSEAKFGFGGYNELRNLYLASSLFDNDLISGENDSIDGPRKLHIGTDIWGEAGTEIFVPLDGTVHSFNFNDHPGDYGPTIILEHVLDYATFYTLYGHLSLNDIDTIGAGTFFSSGDVLGHFGSSSENGGWPPHLHFQVIHDVGDFKGDYPGVCRLSERDYFLQNCPDPDLMLKMTRFVKE